MAVFFKTPAPPGAVVRAEPLFVRRRDRGALLRTWGRGPDGKLACVWLATSEPAGEAAEEPLQLALAS